MSHAQLDLRELALERPKHEPETKPRRKPWLTRYVIPGGILVGFLVLIGVATREHFMPHKAVTVVPVVVVRAEVQQEGTPLFQAAGWVEPRPTPINVAALTEGVIDELLVVEGQEVSAGEPVAKLIDVDAKLTHQQAEATVALREAELESAAAERKGARLRHENPLHLQAALAEAESQLAKSETDGAQIPFLIDATQAQVDYARQNLEGKQAAKDAVAVRTVQKAQSEYKSAEATLKELQQRAPRLQRQVAALKNRVDALSGQLSLLIDETRQLDDAEAKYKAAEARLAEAKVAAAKTSLAFERTVVCAPITGRVLALVASPGSRVMGLDANAGQSSSIVVSLYDPARLQVRADVRLEDVSLVVPGQPVEIETASSKEKIIGRVLLPTSAANIQKNTLEVKVALDNPPPAIRPEMLVTATFLAPPQVILPSDDEPYKERMLIPRQLVQSEGENHSVWVVDPGGIARRKAITLGNAGTKELVEVVEGISPTDKLISSNQQELESEMRVKIVGEDATIGLSDRRS